MGKGGLRSALSFCPLPIDAAVGSEAKGTYRGNTDGPAVAELFYATG